MCVCVQFCELMDCLILSFGLIKIIAETPNYYFKVNTFTRCDGCATLGKFNWTIKNIDGSVIPKILPSHIYMNINFIHPVCSLGIFICLSKWLKIKFVQKVFFKFFLFLKWIWKKNIYWKRTHPYTYDIYIDANTL